MWSKQISSKLFMDAEQRAQLTILLNEVLVSTSRELEDMYEVFFHLPLTPDQCLTMLSSQK